jgi:hypothetical protein
MAIEDLPVLDVKAFSDYYEKHLKDSAHLREYVWHAKDIMRNCNPTLYSWISSAVSLSRDKDYAEQALYSLAGMLAEQFTKQKSHSNPCRCVGAKDDVQYSGKQGPVYCHSKDITESFNTKE